MAIGLLSFIPSEEEHYAGVPASVEITCSTIGAIIYYTLDGTTPSLTSNVYTGPVKSTDDKLILSAIPYEWDGYTFIPGAVLSYTWTQSSAVWTNRRRNYASGFVVSSVSASIPYLYNQDGYASTYLDNPPEESNFVYSTRNVKGPQWSPYNQEIAEPEDTPQLEDDYFSNDYTILGTTTYNPFAKLIVIDAREDSPNKPGVRVANGAFMTLRNPKTYWGGIDYYSLDSTNLVSGSHIRSFHNKDNNTFVAYYFDSIDAKWIKSISTVKVPDHVTSLKVTENPYVFQWTLWGSYRNF